MANNRDAYIVFRTTKALQRQLKVLAAADGTDLSKFMRGIAAQAVKDALELDSVKA